METEGIYLFIVVMEQLNLVVLNFVLNFCAKIHANFLCQLCANFLARQFSCQFLC